MTDNPTSGLVESGFRPAWWLRGPHRQTLWPFFFRRPQPPPLNWERLELDDGDFLELAWHGSSDSDRLCLLLHGLEGCYRSHYLPGLIRKLAAADWRTVVMHFRGCGTAINRLPRSYHSGETGDLARVVRLLRDRERPGILAAIGFSLGGNVLLKYLGECGAAPGRDSGLDTACAVSVPFDLACGARRLNRGVSRIYQWWLVRALQHKIREKFSRMPCPIDLRDLDCKRSFQAFDDYVTAPLHGFRDADDYYRRSSSRAFLRHIRTPTLILHAADDPFLGPDGLPAAHELAPAIRFELSPYGGHVGFVGGRWPWRPHYWLEDRLRDHLAMVDGTAAAPARHPAWQT